jgi:hypothetical protein
VVNIAIQTITLALINTMLQTAGIIGRSQLLQTFDDLGIRQIVLSLNADPSKSLYRQIIEFQTLLAQDLYLKKKKFVSSRTNSSGANQPKKQDGMLDRIRDISGCDSWKKIGFSSETPKKEFQRTGHLGLETLYAIVSVFPIIEFIRKENPKKFKKWTSTPNDPPFAQTCLQAVSIFCDEYQITNHGCMDIF